MEEGRGVKKEEFKGERSSGKEGGRRGRGGGSDVKEGS